MTRFIPLSNYTKDDGSKFLSFIDANRIEVVSLSQADEQFVVHLFLRDDDVGHRVQFDSIEAAIKLVSDITGLLYDTIGEEFTP